MIQVYTGNGKGKTTAALGLAIRAIGHKKKVIMIQFMKGKIDYGELKSAKLLKNLRIEQYGRPDFVNRDNPSKIDRELAKRGFKRAKALVKERRYDIIILDELNVAVEYNLISLEEVIEFLKNFPREMELIITGRYMPKEFLDYADLVTEMREIKHYFQKGVMARKGIDF